MAAVVRAVASNTASVNLFLRIYIFTKRGAERKFCASFFASEHKMQRIKLKAGLLATLGLFPFLFFPSQRALAKPPSGRGEILNFLQQNYGDSYTRMIAAARLGKITAVHIRIYKEERELEVWAGEKGDKLVRLATFPICAMDFAPGPKLRQGDERTPEGLYTLYPRFSSNNWYMRIPIAPDMLERDLDTLGADDYFNKGSVFFYCTDYPSAEDRQRSKSINIKNPGSSICLHGNCVTAGCPSMQNPDFATIFYFLSQHDVKRYGAPKVFMAPFRFKPETNLAAKAEKAAQYNEDTKRLGSARIEAFWQKLKQSEEKFLASPSLAAL